jgi:hypothetical protein
MWDLRSQDRNTRKGTLHKEEKNQIHRDETSRAE